MRTTGARWAVLLSIALALQLVPASPASAQDPTAMQPEPYRTYAQMQQDLQALADEHDVAEYQVHGTSTVGLDIFSVDVAANITERSDEELAELPTLYVDGAHHGNEILSAEAAYYALERVLENATEDPSYLEGKRLIVNPIVNVDGYVRDQRENTNGVDLNRNYPFHWGLYGTSEIPFTGNFRGDSAGSETETQINMELMESTNLYGYVTGHTGTYDLVLPWSEDEDGEIPDWPLYETTLGVIENETGLTYRDPSGAGESHAWAYGNRTALGLLPEVSTEQSAPVSTEEVERRLNEVLQVYRIFWENLLHLGGHLHVEEVTGDGAVLHNDGWGPAYNVTLDVETDAGSTDEERTLPPQIDQIEPGETATLPLEEGAQAVEFQRVGIAGDDPSLAQRSVELSDADGDLGGTADDASGVPGPAVLAALLALLAAALTRRRS